MNRNGLIALLQPKATYVLPGSQIVDGSAGDLMLDYNDHRYWLLAASEVGSKHQDRQLRKRLGEIQRENV